MAITYIAQKSKSPRNRSRVSLFILFTCTVFCVSLRVLNRLKTIRSGFGCDTEEEENVLRAYITYLAVARPVLNQYRPQCMHDVAFRAMFMLVFIYSTVGCPRTWGTWSQPRSFLFFKTPANLVLIFQSVFESRWLACSAHTVGNDACRAGNAAEMFQTVELESFHSQQCRRRSRLHSKRCLGVVRLFLQPGVVLIFDEIPAWPFFGKPFFGTRQYCSVLFSHLLF